MSSTRADRGKSGRSFGSSVVHKLGWSNAVCAVVGAILRRPRLKVRRTGQPFAGVRGSEGYEGQRAWGVRGLCCGAGAGVAPHGGAVDPSGAGRAGSGPDRVGQGVAVVGPDRWQPCGVRAGDHGPVSYTHLTLPT